MKLCTELINSAKSLVNTVCPRFNFSLGNPQLGVSWKLTKAQTNLGVILKYLFVWQFQLKFIGLRTSLFDQLRVSWPVVTNFRSFHSAQFKKDFSAWGLACFGLASLKDVEYFLARPTLVAHLIGCQSFSNKSYNNCLSICSLATV